MDPRPRFLGSQHVRNERRTWAVVALTAVVMVGEIAGGRPLNYVAGVISVKNSADCHRFAMSYGST
jgi:hypothetical protein